MGQGQAELAESGRVPLSPQAHGHSGLGSKAEFRFFRDHEFRGHQYSWKVIYFIFFLLLLSKYMFLMVITDTLVCIHNKILS